MRSTKSFHCAHAVTKIHLSCTSHIVQFADTVSFRKHKAVRLTQIISYQQLLHTIALTHRKHFGCKEPSSVGLVIRKKVDQMIQSQVDGNLFEVRAGKLF
jgi:hypothetical protein